MQEAMSDYSYARKIQKVCQNRCQIECQIECQSICQKECQIECQNIYIYMPYIYIHSDGMPETICQNSVTG